MSNPTSWRLVVSIIFSNTVCLYVFPIRTRDGELLVFMLTHCVCRRGGFRMLAHRSCLRPSGHVTRHFGNETLDR